MRALIIGRTKYDIPLISNLAQTYPPAPTTLIRDDWDTFDGVRISIHNQHYNADYVCSVELKQRDIDSINDHSYTNVNLLRSPNARRIWLETFGSFYVSNTLVYQPEFQGSNNSYSYTYPKNKYKIDPPHFNSGMFALWWAVEIQQYSPVYIAGLDFCGVDVNPSYMNKPEKYQKVLDKIERYCQDLYSGMTKEQAREYERYGFKIGKLNNFNFDKPVQYAKHLREAHPDIEIYKITNWSMLDLPVKDPFNEK